MDTTCSALPAKLSDKNYLVAIGRLLIGVVELSKEGFENWRREKGIFCRGERERERGVRV